MCISTAVQTHVLPLLQANRGRRRERRIPLNHLLKSSGKVWTFTTIHTIAPLYKPIYYYCCRQAGEGEGDRKERCTREREGQITQESHKSLKVSVLCFARIKYTVSDFISPLALVTILRVTEHGGMSRDQQAEEETSKDVEGEDTSTHVGETSKDVEGEDTSTHAGETSKDVEGENTSTHAGETSKDTEEENTSTHAGETSKDVEGENTSTHVGETSKDVEGENTSTHVGETSKDTEEENTSSICNNDSDVTCISESGMCIQYMCMYMYNGSHLRRTCTFYFRPTSSGIDRSKAPGESGVNPGTASSN